MHELELIIVISVLLLIAPFISNLFKLPIAVVEISMGAIFGYLGFFTESHLFKLLAEVGFLYLMFLAGMEVNLRELLQIDKKIFLLGGVFIGLLYILTIVISYALGLSKIFIVILPMLSVGLIVSVQKEIGKSKWIHFAITIGVLGELVSILVLTIISGIFELGIGLALYKSIFTLFLFIAILIGGYYLIKTIFWWFPTIRHYMMPNDDKYNQDLRISFALFFILIAIMLYLHLDVVLGAFVAGVLIKSFFEHNTELEDKLSPFGFGFLITIFFIHVGSTFDLHYLFNKDVLKITCMIVIIMISIRIISSLVFWHILSKKELLLFSLSLSMPLTLLIATATLAYQAKSIDLIHYNSFILSAILEVLIAMIGIKIIKRYSIN
ncbi:MAG: cation:proton antiporter [Epsilonproteobacteria bacterium]|nr:cation:proton antiporter [Campylobacterota bacterium]